MKPSDVSRARFSRRARLPAVLIGLMLVLTGCFTTVTTPFGDIVVFVCDYGDFPIEGLQVEIGGTVKTTDADGRVEFGTVQLPYIANLFDATNNYLASYQGLDFTELRIFHPFSAEGTAANQASVSGSVNPLGSGDHDVRVAAVADRRTFRGDVDETTLDYGLDLRWKASAGVSAAADLYALERTFIPNPGFTPGIVTAVGVAYEQQTFTDGDSATVDLDIISHPTGGLNVNFFPPNGWTLEQRRHGAIFGTVAMGVGVRFPVQRHENPPLNASLFTIQVPPGWVGDWWVEHRLGDGSGAEQRISSTGLDYNANVNITASALDTNFPGLRDGDTFEEGDSINVGQVAQDTSLALQLTPTSASDLTLFLFGNTNLIIPDLSVFNIDLRAGAAYQARLVRFSWSLEDLASKLADPYVIKKGVSSRFDLSSSLSTLRDVRVVGNGGGVTPPVSALFFRAGSLRFKEAASLWADWDSIAIRSQASSCPQLSIAATAGSIIVDACDGSVLKTYAAGASTAYFDSLILPVPPGETGSPSLFQSGTGYFLAALDANGDAGLGQAGSGPFIDSTPIGDDAANGASYINAAFGNIGFVVFDSATGFWIFDPFVIQPADLDDGTFTHTARSAIMNPAGDQLLVVGRRVDSTLHLLHVTLDAMVGLSTQAVASVSVVGPLGSDPRRVRCDFASERCGVSDRTDNTVTVVDWDGSGAPSITATADVAAGPVGIDVLGDRIVSAGYDDDRYSVISLAANGSVAGISTSNLPADCTFPGHALFLDDPGNAVIVTCNGDGTAGDPGGYVYIPGAF